MGFLDYIARKVFWGEHKNDGFLIHIICTVSICIVKSQTFYLFAAFTGAFFHSGVVICHVKSHCYISLQFLNFV